jgi:Zn-dependent protease
VRLGPIELLRDDPILFVLLAAALIGALTLHEFAHAAAATAQGDRLPRATGRLTVNPLRHLDPLGTLLIFLVGFGWAKPVQFRPDALRSKRFGAALVALAGPLMNLLLAVAGVVVYGVLEGPFALEPLGPGQSAVTQFFVLFISINVILAVFNLIPLPPLDGSRLLTIFLPPNKQRIIFFLDQYGFIILLVLIFFAGPALLRPMIDVVLEWVLRAGGAI